mmetsp:Transcript_16016/g.37108  ORF Transcript_16016/g.37108 Transcript_16016/m.37108 type:complete len:355 (+) Transcript_16016:529-1593(+)
MTRGVQGIVRVVVVVHARKIQLASQHPDLVLPDHFLLVVLPQLQKGRIRNPRAAVSVEVWIDRVVEDVDDFLARKILSQNIRQVVHRYEPGIVRIESIKGLCQPSLADGPLSLDGGREEFRVSDPSRSVQIHSVEDRPCVLRGKARLRPRLVELVVRNAAGLVLRSVLLKHLPKDADLLGGRPVRHDHERHLLQLGVPCVPRHRSLRLEDLDFFRATFRHREALVQPDAARGLFGVQSLVGVDHQQVRHEILGGRPDPSPAPALKVEFYREDLLHDVLALASVKGHLRREQHVSYDADGPNIGLFRVASLQNLRCHSVYRPHAFRQRFRSSITDPCGPVHLRQPEIDELDIRLR